MRQITAAGVRRSLRARANMLAPEDDDEAFDAAVSTLYAKRIKRNDYINDARGFLPAVTDAAIDSAIADALEAEEFDRIPAESLALVGSLLVRGVQNVILSNAKDEVRREFEQQAREAEEDAARERMEA